MLICQENNYFLLKLSHFCYQFSRHSQLFLAHNFQHYLKVLGVSAKEHPISTDISSREHTYLNNDFLNKKHIDGKQNFLIFKVFHLVNHTPNNPLGEMLLEIQKYQIQADIGVNQSTARKIKKYQRKWECVIKEDPTKCIYK